MSSKNYLTRLLPLASDSSKTVEVPPLPKLFDPGTITLHIISPEHQNDHPSSSQVSLSTPRDSSEGLVAVRRQHFVVHGPSCKESKRCDLLERQAPTITPCAVGIPRAHIVAVSRFPTRYDRSALWARPLSRGPLIGVGDKMWLEGVGAVVLRESSVAGASPFWKFFSVETKKYGVVELATEWSGVQLTSEEYELRASSRLAGRGEDDASDRLRSFLDFDPGWPRRAVDFWKQIYSRIIAIFLHRAVDPTTV